MRPSRCDKLLLDYLDIGRFQKTPRADAITGAVSSIALLPHRRHRRASCSRPRATANPEVKITRSDPAGSLPRLTMTVVPGPRVEVRNVSLDAATPLAPKTASRDEPWSDRLDHLRKIWPLPPGKPFREADWSGGKTATLGALRADGYPKANWQSTRARIDATDNVADLELVAESGPLYHLGEIRVDGVSVFDEVTVRRMATFFRGQVYSERLLLDYRTG